MYALERLQPDLWLATLPKPSIGSIPGARPSNVYIVTGDHPALINTGHPDSHAGLTAALAQLDLTPSDIERVVATSWHPDALGDLSRWRHADVFALSADLVSQRRQESWRAGRRAAWREVFDACSEHPELAALAEATDLDAFLDAFLPKTSDSLPLVPLLDGHTVALGDLRLEVVSATGPDPGHMLLHERDRGILFTSDLLGDPLPPFVASVEHHLAALERANALAPSLVLPNHGRPDPYGDDAVDTSQRRMTNYLQSASMTLSDGPTVFDFVDRDLGITPRDLIRYMDTLLSTKSLLDEIVRARLVDAAGTGYARRYGLSPDDPHLTNPTRLRGRLAPVPLTGPSPFER